jgi:hypothetical protein
LKYSSVKRGKEKNYFSVENMIARKKLFRLNNTYNENKITVT